jgi:outer membrane protein
MWCNGSTRPKARTLASSKPTLHWKLPLETSKAEAGHKPTLDLVGSYSAINQQWLIDLAQRQPGQCGHDGTELQPAAVRRFTPCKTASRKPWRWKTKARADLEAAKRSVAQATRTAYFGVQSGQAQVKALEAAEASSQSALDANKLGYQVGVRINIDVLNSQSQLFDTKAKLAKARYDVLWVA